ncbi:DUF2306 domain-containing protein [Neorhodopirellula pilleata]|uniref:DUF2306 domain-containing protein n=1 Tax=Neorhodopirellula pilleata TaxID=2714738 RepID=A0A5C6A503_9BACT|nr:DUF2306 domain-containing protein [Neorhodopirellula pilleata]TWT94378.1 hypothetical protein Pla100_39900 [Neorhodopirellula pilleata]
MNTPIRTAALVATLRLAVMALAVKVWVSILTEYPLYFPADFSAAFLIGREEVFDGLYRFAFYSHIVVGPIALILAAWLLFGGQKLTRRRSTTRARQSHRRVGRVQAILVLGILVPSGLVMAWDAHTGPIAGWGFGSLSIATAATMLMAIRKAISGDFEAHRLWATRCFLCLVSPLILRVSMGVSITLAFESETFYQFNAWASWMIPLAIYEFRLLPRRMPSGASALDATMAHTHFPDSPVSSQTVSYQKVMP